MLDKEFQFYLDNQVKLYNDHPGKCLVIVGDELKGAFDNVREAYKFGRLEFGLGNFLMQKSILGTMAYTAIYYNAGLFEVDR